MLTVIKDLIEYEGFDNINITSNNNAFKQINMNGFNELPSYKPNISQITRASIETKIIDSYLMKTPVGKSEEGIILTGYKLFITGGIKVKVQYLSGEEYQLVNTFLYEVAYSGAVVLPKGTSDKSYIAPGLLVEDIFIKENAKRSIYSSISLILTASIC